VWSRIAALTDHHPMAQQAMIWVRNVIAFMLFGSGWLGLYDLGQVIHQEVDSEFVAFAFGVSEFVQHDFIAILNDYLPLAFATHYHTWI
jgi:hypothetical protein